MNREHIVPQLLLRSWPFPRGAGRLIDMFFEDLKFSGERAIVRTTDGFEMTVIPNELIGRHLYLTGEFDRSTVEVLLGLAQPGDTLLDIGANVGYVSACFIKNVARSFVIALDPQPLIVPLLQSNLAQFGEQRSIVLPVGLSDRDARGWMEICNRNLGESKVVSTKQPGAVEIQLWSAKKLFGSIERQVDLIKIDVEGHELTILNACKEEIAIRRPRAVLFEDHTRAAAPDGAIGILFREIGYQVRSIQKRLTRLIFTPINSADDCQSLDYLATPAIPLR